MQIIPSFVKKFGSWCLNRVKGFWRWLTMRKAEVVTPQDLWFFHTKRILVIFVLFVAICGFSAVAFISIWKDGEGMSSVPDVIGKPLLSALFDLQDKNLHGIVKTISDISHPTGVVLAQDPKGGFFTRERRGVVLFLNQPALSTEVPNIIGKTPAEATALLIEHADSNYEVRLGRISYGRSETIPEGRIVAQNPTPNTPARRPLVVDVVISQGRAHSVVDLPDFRGQSFESAARWLALNSVTAVALQNRTGAAGIVSAQDPGPGRRIGKGDAVSLTVGGSQKYGVIDFIFPLMLKLSQASLNFTTAALTQTGNQELSVDQLKLRQQQEEERLQRELIREGDESYPVEITLVNAQGGRALIYRGVHKPGDHLVQVFSYTDEVTMELNIGGRKFISRKYQ